MVPIAFETLLLLLQVPSYKFIPLTYQISSRVGLGDDGSFRAVVHKLILRLCREHPHHSLLQLLALANGEKVSGGGGTQARETGGKRRWLVYLSILLSKTTKAQSGAGSK